MLQPSEECAGARVGNWRCWEECHYVCKCNFILQILS